MSDLSRRHTRRGWGLKRNTGVKKLWARTVLEWEMPWELHELPAWVPLEILLRGEWAVTNAPSLGVFLFRNTLVVRKAEESFKFSIY